MLLAVLSLLGGLYTSISAVAYIAVAIITRTNFITTVTKNLFLIKKLQENEPEDDSKSDERREFEA